MGFEGEFASYEPLRRILSNERIHALQQRMRIQPAIPREEIEKKIIKLKDLPKSTTQQPDYILAIDGSHLEGYPEKGYPGAECGVVTIASVLLDLEKITQLGKNDFIDPKKFRETEKASSQESIFPGCNVVITPEKDAKASLRRMLFEEMGNVRIFSEGETLLETYEYLFRIKRQSKETKPPRNPIDDEYELIYNDGEYDCPYTKEKLFSTDALRLHELMNPGGTNGELFGQIMSTFEKLWLINIIRWFDITNKLDILRYIAFIIDGPLAVFSTSSWLTKVIEIELERINKKQKEINGDDLIILGLEKSGSFVNHFEDIDTSKEGISDNIFERQSVFLLTDSYIKENIIYSESDKMYGKDTYFGRKFFYKASSGQKLVPVLACYTDEQRDLTTANVSQFPRLADVLQLLDRLVSSRYNNSISPLISAHAEAAIPLRLGKRLFEDITREIAESSNITGI